MRDAHAQRVRSVRRVRCSRRSNKRIPAFVGTTALGTHESRLPHALRARPRCRRHPAGPADVAAADGRDGGRVLPQRRRAVPESGHSWCMATRARSVSIFRPSSGPASSESVPTITSAKYSRPKALLESRKHRAGSVHFLPNDGGVMKFVDLAPETTTACWSTAASMGPEPALAQIRAIQAHDLERARAIAKDLAWTREPIAPISADADLFASYNIQLEKVRIALAGLLQGRSAASALQPSTRPSTTRSSKRTRRAGARSASVTRRWPRRDAAPRASRRCAASNSASATSTHRRRSTRTPGCSMRSRARRRRSICAAPVPSTTCWRSMPAGRSVWSRINLAAADRAAVDALHDALAARRCDDRARAARSRRTGRRLRLRLRRRRGTRVPDRGRHSRAPRRRATCPTAPGKISHIVLNADPSERVRAASSATCWGFGLRDQTGARELSSAATPTTIVWPSAGSAGRRSTTSPSKSPRIDGEMRAAGRMKRGGHPDRVGRGTARSRQQRLRVLRRSRTATRSSTRRRCSKSTTRPHVAGTPETLEARARTPTRGASPSRRRNASATRSPVRFGRRSMLSQQDNERLTPRRCRDADGERCSAATGFPALLSEELPEPDGAPVRVRLLGEDLVALSRHERRGRARRRRSARTAARRCSSAATKSAGCAASITAGSSTATARASTCRPSRPTRCSRRR